MHILTIKHGFTLWIGIPRGTAMKYSFASVYINNIAVTKKKFGEGKKDIREEMTSMLLALSEICVLYLFCIAPVIFRVFLQREQMQIKHRQSCRASRCNIWANPGFHQNSVVITSQEV